MTTDELTPYQQWKQQSQASGENQIQLSPPRPVFPPEVAKARKADKVRRQVEARRRASVVLALRHQDEYDELLAAEKAGVDRERGPLPGDSE